MPRSVVLFERLAYAALTFEVLAILIDPLNRAEWGMAGSLLVAAIAILITSLIVWAAARRRKNWARYLYVVLGVIGMASTIWSFTDEGQSMLVHVLNVAADLCFIAAAYHAFIRESRPWFHPNLSGDAQLGSPPQG
jgi:fluoride ion exporter CrcB/FEX